MNNDSQFLVRIRKFLTLMKQLFSSLQHATEWKQLTEMQEEVWRKELRITYSTWIGMIWKIILRKSIGLFYGLSSSSPHYHLALSQYVTKIYNWQGAKNYKSLKKNWLLRETFQTKIYSKFAENVSLHKSIKRTPRFCVDKS